MLLGSITIHLHNILWFSRYFHILAFICRLHPSPVGKTNERRHYLHLFVRWSILGLRANDLGTVTRQQEAGKWACTPTPKFLCFPLCFHPWHLGNHRRPSPRNMPHKEAEVPTQGEMKGEGWLWTRWRLSPFTCWCLLPRGICGFLKLVGSPQVNRPRYPTIGSWLSRLVHPQVGLEGTSQGTGTLLADLKTSVGMSQWKKRDAEQCVWCAPNDTSRGRERWNSRLKYFICIKEHTGKLY